jgi:hypothetical protein
VAFNTAEYLSFSQKWAKLNALAVANGVSSPQISAVYDQDLQRLQSPGDYTMSDTEAMQSLLSVKQGVPTTQAPPTPFSVGSLPGDAVTDVQDLGVGLLGLVKKGMNDVIHPSDLVGQVSALWRDPKVLENPAKALFDFPSYFKPGDPITAAFSNSPLLTALLPGVYDVGQIGHYGLGKGMEQLAEHPVSSLLDLLPFFRGASEAAAAVARTGLPAESVDAARSAMEFSPFATDKAALDARAAFRETLPSGISRAALYGETGMGGMIIRTLAGMPWDDGSVGDALSQWLGMKTGGLTGWESMAVGKLFTQARRMYAHDTSALSKAMNDFYERHGITDTKLKDDFARAATHYAPGWDKTLGIGPEEAAKLQPALDEYKTTITEEANKDLAQSRLGIVEDPRTGAEEIRALDGNDGRVVRASARSAALDQQVRDLTTKMQQIMDYPFVGDPEVAVKEWMGSNLLQPLGAFTIIDPKEIRLAPSLFDGKFSTANWAKVAKLFGPKGSISRLRDALAEGDFTKATTLLRSIRATLRGQYALTNPALARAAEDLPRASEVLSAFVKGRPVLEKAAKAKTLLTTLIDRFPEARFSPRLTEIVGDRLMAHLKGTNVDPETFDLLYKMVGNGVWKGQMFDERVGAKAWSKIVQSARDQLVAERGAGFDPIWVPTTTATEAPKLGQAGIDLERISKSRSLKSRAQINPSAVHDPILGLFRKGAEDLEEKRMNELFYGDGGIKARWGLTHDQAIAQAMQFAKGVTLDDTRLTHSHILDQWVRDNYTTIKPKDWISRTPTHATGMGAMSEDEFLIPKSVDNAFKANVKAVRGPENFAVKGYMRGTRIFVYTLLNFSPRYLAHIYFGGAFLALHELGPGVLQYLPAAAGMALQDSDGLLEFIHSHHMGPLKPVADWLVSRATKQGEKGLSPMITHELAETSNELMKEWNYAAGSKLGGWLDKLMANRGLSAGTEIAKFGADMWRAAAYLSGKAEGGAERGIETALQVFANMDDLMPLERSIIKYVMPFYGWTRHILRYAVRFPIDHPLRASLEARMVNQEWEDWPTGYPASLMYLFQIGPTDAAGNATTIDIRQLDPLRSVTDVFTMSGFMSSLNPLFQSVLIPAIGINPATAEPGQLYPTLTLDNFYGTETQVGTNPLSVLTSGIGGYVPEAQVVDHFLGLTSYTRWAKQNDPQAYKNQLFQALNFPWMPQQTNLYATLAKSEQHNYSLAADAVKSALNDPDPNGTAWKYLMNYTSVPFSGWIVQPQALRQWTFDQVVASGYWENGQATLPPSNIIVDPKAPRL